MPQRDPFSGVRLSKLVEPETDKLDQRLFEPAPKPQNKATAQPATAVALAEPQSNVARSKNLSEPAEQKAAVQRPTFRLSERPFYKLSYLYTEEEQIALENLRAELNRDRDTEDRVTKNDLVRAALHMLLEDHAVNGERSYASRKVRKR